MAAAAPTFAPVAEAPGGKLDPKSDGLLASGLAPGVPALAASAPSPFVGSARGADAPAVQLAPALVQVAHAAGGHQITLQLAPDELGKVSIRIDRAPDGTASVQVVVERPETLKLLQADQPQLHRALDQAGLPQEGRSLTLSLAANDAAAGQSGPGGSGGNPAGSQSGGGERQSRPGPGWTPPAATNAHDFATTPAWQRVGIDITA